MNDRDKDWFRPLWRRVTLVVGLVVWLGWESWTGYFTRPEQPDYMWIMIVGAALVYAVYSLFITFDSRGGGPEDKQPPAAG